MFMCEVLLFWQLDVQSKFEIVPSGSYTSKELYYLCQASTLGELEYSLKSKKESLDNVPL